MVRARARVRAKVRVKVRVRVRVTVKVTVRVIRAVTLMLSNASTVHLQLWARQETKPAGVLG